MANTPRHIFIEEALSHRAYEDTSLPIGFGQTISRPYIVAKMTELLLEQGPLESVLEIGTGCGYQTVVLSQLVGRVYSVERIAPLKLKPEKQRLYYELITSNLCIRMEIGGGLKKGHTMQFLSAGPAPDVCCSLHRAGQNRLKNEWFG